MGNKASLSRSQEREQFWRKIVSGQPRSGMSVLAWCERHGVSAPSFYVWRQRLAQSDADRKLRRPQLLPVEIIPAAAVENGSALEIELPSQVRVREGGLFATVDTQRVPVLLAFSTNRCARRSRSRMARRSFASCWPGMI